MEQLSLSTPPRFRKPLLIFLRIVVFLCIWGCFFDATHKWNSFENYSENLVTGPMFAAQHGLAAEGGSFGLGLLTIEDCPAENEYSAYYQYRDRYPEMETFLTDDTTCDYWVYTSSLGLQGTIFTAIAKRISTPSLYLAFRLGCMGGLALVLMLIAELLNQRYGLVQAGCFLAVSVLSPWITKFSPNLYWMEFLWFVPMLLGLYCLVHPRQRFLVYPLVFAATLVKCFCGFEYLSTIMVGSVLWLAAEWLTAVLRKKKEAGLYFRMIAGLGLAQVAAFAAALVVTANKLYPGGNALSQFYAAKVARRLMGTDPDDSATDISPLKVLWAYLSDKIGGKAILALLILAVVVLLVQRRVCHQDVLPKACLLAVAFFGAVSWFVLAKQHSYIHQHLNFVLWFLGTAQIAVYIVADFFLPLLRGSE
ncbi:MAG: hypothetical protein ACI4OI_01470 [Gemmiger sp.]